MFTGKVRRQIIQARGHVHMESRLTSQAAPCLHATMPRRSSRLESKPAIAFSEQDADTPGGNDNDFTEDHLSDAEHKEPTSKKRKTKTSSASTSKNTKGKRGKLRQLP